MQTADPVAYRIDPTTITLIGGMIVTIIGSLVTGIVTIITAMRVSAVATQQQTTAGQVVAMAKDTEAIKGHVNSEKTAANGREATLQQENRMLREMLTDKATTAAMLAQAAAGRGPSRSTDAPLTNGAAPVQVEVVNDPLIVTKESA